MQEETREKPDPTQPSTSDESQWINPATPWTDPRHPCKYLDVWINTVRVLGHELGSSLRTLFVEYESLHPFAIKLLQRREGNQTTVIGLHIPTVEINPDITKKIRSWAVKGKRPPHPLEEKYPRAKELIPAATYNGEDSLHRFAVALDTSTAGGIHVLWDVSKFNGRVPAQLQELLQGSGVTFVWDEERQKEVWRASFPKDAYPANVVNVIDKFKKNNDDIPNRSDEMRQHFDKKQRVADLGTTQYYLNRLRPKAKMNLDWGMTEHLSTLLEEGTQQGAILDLWMAKVNSEREKPISREDDKETWELLRQEVPVTAFLQTALDASSETKQQYLERIRQILADADRQWRRILNVGLHRGGCVFDTSGGRSAPMSGRDLNNKSAAFVFCNGMDVTQKAHETERLLSSIDIMAPRSEYPNSILERCKPKGRGIEPPEPISFRRYNYYSTTTRKRNPPTPIKIEDIKAKAAWQEWVTANDGDEDGVYGFVQGNMTILGDVADPEEEYWTEEDKTDSECSEDTLGNRRVNGKRPVVYQKKGGDLAVDELISRLTHKELRAQKREVIRQREERMTKRRERMIDMTQLRNTLIGGGIPLTQKELDAKLKDEWEWKDAKGNPITHIHCGIRIPPPTLETLPPVMRSQAVNVYKAMKFRAAEELEAYARQCPFTDESHRSDRVIPTRIAPYVITAVPAFIPPGKPPVNRQLLNAFDPPPMPSPIGGSEPPSDTMDISSTTGEDGTTVAASTMGSGGPGSDDDSDATFDDISYKTAKSGPATMDIPIHRTESTTPGVPELNEQEVLAASPQKEREAKKAGDNATTQEGRGHKSREYARTMAQVGKRAESERLHRETEEQMQLEQRDRANTATSQRSDGPAEMANGKFNQLLSEKQQQRAQQAFANAQVNRPRSAHPALPPSFDDMLEQPRPTGPDAQNRLLPIRQPQEKLIPMSTEGLAWNALGTGLCTPTNIEALAMIGKLVAEYNIGSKDEFPAPNLNELSDTLDELMANIKSWSGENLPTLSIDAMIDAGRAYKEAKALRSSVVQKNSQLLDLARKVANERTKARALMQAANHHIAGLRTRCEAKEVNAQAALQESNDGWNATLALNREYAAIIAQQRDQIERLEDEKRQYTSALNRLPRMGPQQDPAPYQPPWGMSQLQQQQFRQIQQQQQQQYEQQQQKLQQRQQQHQLKQQQEQQARKQQQLLREQEQQAQLQQQEKERRQQYEAQQEQIKQQEQLRRQQEQQLREQQQAAQQQQLLQLQQQQQYQLQLQLQQPQPQPQQPQQPQQIQQYWTQQQHYQQQHYQQQQQPQQQPFIQQQQQFIPQQHYNVQQPLTINTQQQQQPTYGHQHNIELGLRLTPTQQPPINPVLMERSDDAPSSDSPSDEQTLQRKGQQALQRRAADERKREHVNRQLRTMSEHRTKHVSPGQAKSATRASKLKDYSVSPEEYIKLGAKPKRQSRKQERQSPGTSSRDNSGSSTPAMDVIDCRVPKDDIFSDTTPKSDAKSTTPKERRPKQPASPLTLASIQLPMPKAITTTTKKRNSDSNNDDTDDKRQRQHRSLSKNRGYGEGKRPAAQPTQEPDGKPEGRDYSQEVRGNLETSEKPPVRLQTEPEKPIPLVNLASPSDGYITVSSAEDTPTTDTGYTTNPTTPTNPEPRPAHGVTTPPPPKDHDYIRGRGIGRGRGKVIRTDDNDSSHSPPGDQGQQDRSSANDSTNESASVYMTPAQSLLSLAPSSRPASPIPPREPTPGQKLGMKFLHRPVNYSLTAAEQRKRRMDEHNRLQVQRLRISLEHLTAKNNEAAAQNRRTQEPAFGWIFYNLEWMVHWRPRGLCLRLARRYFTTVDHLGHEIILPDNIAGIIKVQVTTAMKDLRHHLLQTHPSVTLTEQQFLSWLTSVERMARQDYIAAERRTLNEGDYDRLITALARRLRMYISKTIAKGEKLYRKLPTIAAIPLMPDQIQFGGRNPEVMYGIFMGVERYWHPRQAFARALRNLPIRNYNEATGVADLPPNILTMAARLGELTTEQLEGLEDLIVEMTAGDFYESDRSVDDGGDTDYEDDDNAGAGASAMAQN